MLFHLRRNLNELSIRYQSDSKSRNVNTIARQYAFIRTLISLSVTAQGTLTNAGCRRLVIHA